MNLKSKGAVILLSIMMPMGLLAVFRVTGVLHDAPVISETMRLSSVMWETVRSGAHSLRLGENLNTSFAGDVTLRHDIEIDKMEAIPTDLGGSDWVGLVVYASGALEHGFICGVNITFWENYTDSLVELVDVGDWQRMYSSPINYDWSHASNLSLLSYTQYQQGSGLKAFVALEGVNQPKSIYFDGNVYWELESPYSQAHQIEVDIEVVYYNGTAFKDVIQPFVLKIAPDNNNDFKNAPEIFVGNYTNLYVGYEDPVDYYKIYLNQGERIQVYVYGISEPKAMLNVYVYDSDGKPKGETSQLGTSQTMAFTSDSVGYWFIQIQSDVPNSSGFYNLEVS